MNWITDQINTIFTDFVNDFFTTAMDLIARYIIGFSSFTKYIDYEDYDGLVFYICGGLIIVLILVELNKIQTNNYGKGGAQTRTELIYGIFIGGFMTVVSRFYLITKIIPTANALFEAIAGVNTTTGTINVVGMLPAVFIAFSFQSVITTILIIGLVVLLIVSVILYWQMWFLVFSAPFVGAISISRREALGIWFIEIIGLIMTKVLHIILFRGLANMLIDAFSYTDILDQLDTLLGIIGLLVFMVSAPNIIRKMLYSSGVASSGVSAAGQGGRLYAMSKMFRGK